MKLRAFRIRNYRSIVDSGWQNFSPDNITCLIGQNESGKTSILEALRDFYSGFISEDVLRSDLSLPEVNCRFSVDEGWLLNVTVDPGTELKELLSGLKEVELKRKWIADLSSVLSVGGEVEEYLNSLEDAWKLYLENVTITLREEIKDIELTELQIASIEKEENEILERNGLKTFKRIGFRLFTKNRDKLTDGTERDQTEDEKLLETLKNEKELRKKLLEGKSALKNAGAKWQSMSDSYKKTEDRINELSARLEERHQRLTLLISDPEEESGGYWNSILNDFRRSMEEKEVRLAELEHHIAATGFLMGGSTPEEAKRKAEEIIRTYKSANNGKLLGARYFEFCPVFELFEDFGSLLPNRIDLEDIISGNEQVEGYKAARNFLSLASLNYSFFEQPSSRILKQTIENLNQSLTRNFHDFWQQKIGRNNKINIQFELEHYNSTYGAKAGKPYLEFWIKDEGERLYPKQRSRGVRWFLSFYMELKASANIKNRDLVLLVDEPGVSLHARAQEDVLKVFEDIKDRIQVIYTTHSPHLVEISKLHRVLAVQRDDMENFRSATRIFDPLRLTSATSDTLTPLQSIMGNSLSGEALFSKRMNIVVNDTGSFYMLSAIIMLAGFKGKINIIPSIDVSKIPILCNIIMGWGLEFTVILFNNPEENRMAEQLKGSVFSTEGRRELILRLPEEFLNAEDILSTLDMKHHILNTREGITVPNSVYIQENQLARNFILSRFLADVKAGKVTADDLDEESRTNIERIVELLRKLK